MMVNRNLTYREAVEKADNFKAIGETCIHLWEQVELPWEYVTSVEPGGSHRLDIYTSVNIEASHPSGLVFVWHFDIEHRGANGQGHYELDTEGCKHVLSQLPLEAKHQFQAYLLECAAQVHKHATEGWGWCQREFRDAETLRKLGDAKPEEVPT